MHLVFDIRLSAKRKTDYPVQTIAVVAPLMRRKKAWKVSFKDLLVKDQTKVK